MKLIPILQLSPGREALCLVGGGGKTTLLYRLAHEALETGSVCVTTSTHIALPSAEQALYVQTFDEQAFLQGLQQQKVLCIGSLTDLRDEAGVQKLSMAPEPWLAFAQSHTDWLFCEADGARHFPAKVPNETEPVLLPGSAVLAVFGLSAIGKPLQEVCFRAPLALSLLGT